MATLAAMQRPAPQTAPPPTRTLAWLLAALSVAALNACVPVGEDADPGARVEVDFNDPEQRRLYDLQDALAVDSLVAYLAHERPELRYLAARAFASVMSDSAVAPLSRLLLDPIEDVRAAAAYALGQQGAPRAAGPLLQAYDRHDTAGVYAEANGAILEAVGKVGDTAMLAALSSISTFYPRDTALLLGQARGLYRMALRGLVSPTGTDRMLALATDRTLPTAVRLVGAHYLQRAGGIDLTGRATRLNDAIRDEGDVYVRAALSRALGATGDPAAPALVARRYASEESPLVRVELLRAAGRLPYAETRALLLGAVRDADPLVGETAARQLLAAGSPEDASQYWRLAKDSVSAEASLGLYAAALRHMPAYLQDYRRYINAELRRGFRESGNDPYRGAGALRVLAEAPWNYRYLVEVALDPETGTVARTAAAEALLEIARRDDLPAYFRGSLPTVTREYAAYLEAALAVDDPGLRAVAATTIAEAELALAPLLRRGDFLEAAATDLDLPRDTETLYAIEDAKARLRPGYAPDKPAPTYNHAITWDIYRSLPPGLEVLIETPRGTITVDLLDDEAPGTVVSFVQAVRNGYYNGRRFHRVVPGFVTQGGGPRGDGYGSLDYSLRTETPPVYYDAPGYVGMASAGRHTEGVQFFFTHQPTPHLDGRYTAFGRVTDGLDAVTALRRGDEMRVRLR